MRVPVLLDRAADLRGRPDVLEQSVLDAAARVVAVRGDELPTRPGADGRPVLVTFPPADLGDLLRGAVDARTDPADDGARAAPVLVLLGLDRSAAGPVPFLALLLPEGAAVPDASTGEDVTWSGLRTVAADLGAGDRELATTSLALAHWHARHVRCPRCGARTLPAQAGWVRRCVDDGSEHYPRTDPAVIMAVVDAEDRLLLGHAAPWPAGRFSTLAGYVEPGESLEDAVRREVAEETSVQVGDVEYRASQPWPFPSSLMLAFRAHAVTTDVVVDGTEVTDARWFTRVELDAAVADGTVLLPSRSSIAWALVQEWRTGEPFRLP